MVSVVHVSSLTHTAVLLVLFFHFYRYKFSQFVLNTITAHDPSVPLFYNYDFHIVHEPLEIPAKYYHMFDMIKNSSVGDYNPDSSGLGVGHRQCYNSMVHYMDMVIGEIVALLKSKNMYDDTVIFFQSDNGEFLWWRWP